MVTIAKNCALNILRAERKTTAFPEDRDLPAQETRQKEHNYLVSLTQSLPESHRRILELKCAESEEPDFPTVISRNGCACRRTLVAG